MRKALLAVASILAIAAPTRADYGAAPSASYNVDSQTYNPGQYYLFSTNVIGSGAIYVSDHTFYEVYAFDLGGTVTGLTIGGDVTDLRRISAGGDPTTPTYASLNLPASFTLSIAVMPAPPSLDAAGLGATITGSGVAVGSAKVDDGVTPPSGLAPVGPGFSIALGQPAVEAANAAISAGGPLYLVLSGRGLAAGFGYDASLEGYLTSVTLDVQTAAAEFSDAPGLAPMPVPEPSAVALLGLGVVLLFGRRLRARPPAGPPSDRRTKRCLEP